MAILKLILDTRRARKDKTFPLVFRISAKGDTQYIYTGLYIQIQHWNTNILAVKETLPDYETVYDNLQKLKAKYLEKMADYEQLNPNQVTARELKEYLTALPKPKVTVADFWQREIQQLHKSNRNGSANVYDQTITAIQKICSLNISFEQVNYKFLKELEAQLYSKGLKVNTIGIYFRTFKALYNKAINSQEVGFEYYPFRNFRIKREIVRPRTLTLLEMQKYFGAGVEVGTWLYESWLMGKLMFMLIGINFKDMALMSETQIQHGRLIYNRAKTKRQYSIKLLPEALEILNYFEGRGKRTLLGKINDADIDDKVKLEDIMTQANKVFNKHIGLIGKNLEIKEKLTGYCFRYSWANIAKQLDYSKDLISEALGHSYGLRVTGIYLEAYDLKHIDEMNKTVCDEVKNKAQEK